jgi:hypothetical protein
MTKLTTNERAIVVTALRHAVPYIRMYKRRVFVLKAGGDAFVPAVASKRKPKSPSSALRRRNT